MHTVAMLGGSSPGAIRWVEVVGANIMLVRIIANPVAGRGRSPIVAGQIADELRRRGAEVDLRSTQKQGDARDFAAETGANVIVSIGGDGTANEIANGLIDPEVKVAVVAMGSANVVARQFRLPKSPEAVAAMVLAGKVAPMDLGLHGGRHFVMGAGAGLDAAITARVEGTRKRTSSVWRWVVPSIQTILSYDSPPIRVLVDGEVASDGAHYAIVGNCIYSAGVFPSTPRAKTDDGLLDVCLLHGLRPLKMLELAFSVWNPRFIERNDIVYRQGREIQFESADGRPVPVQVDGDPAGQIPANFVVAEKKLSLLVP